MPGSIELREAILQKIKARKLFEPRLATAEALTTAVAEPPPISPFPEPAKISPQPKGAFQKFAEFETTVPRFAIGQTRKAVDEVLGLLRKGRETIQTGLPPIKIKGEHPIMQAQQFIESGLRGG